MSRIGKKPIPVPSGVKIAVSGSQVCVEAGSNKLAITTRPEVTVRFDDQTRQVIVERRDDERQSKASHGLTRALINNMITGVTQGFVKELEITGVGWSAQLKGQQVSLNVGYADAKLVPVPAGVKVEIAGNKIKISGSDKQKVGQVAAEIRSKRPPEPYNGKGIKYSDEKIVRKEGKAFAGGGG
ncbi:MAG: 50S ribosomal protein L6 [Phycisphaeraceae bacterium]|nr:50S ribosomal protein L6 [Phycisphaeraceae bacterium]